MDYITLKKNIDVIKVDVQKHPLTTFFILSFLLLIIYLSASNFLNRPTSPTYQPPKIELTYSKEESSKDESTGLYITNFLLKINRPPGNFDLNFSLQTAIPNAECSEPKENSSVTQTISGIASSTYEYSIECKTYRPIIDTGKLFYLNIN